MSLNRLHHRHHCHHRRHTSSTYLNSCKYCKALAPTYEKLSQDFHKLEATHGFYFAKYNCMENMQQRGTTPPNDIVIHSFSLYNQPLKELCDKEVVDGFPTLLVYNDGKRIEEYLGQREYEPMAEYIKEKSERYRIPIIVPLDKKTFHGRTKSGLW